MIIQRVLAPRPHIDEAALRALTEPHLHRWLFAALIDWAVVIAVFAAVGAIDHPLVYALAIVPLGSRQQALGALFHDAAHRLASRNAWTNDFFGNVLAAWPLGLTLGGYRRYHFAHHKHLGTELDPEITHKRTIPQWSHRIHVPAWLAHLIMPHDIGLHWEHHHFPNVPFWNLHALRA